MFIKYEQVLEKPLNDRDIFEIQNEELRNYYYDLMCMYYDEQYKDDMRRKAYEQAQVIKILVKLYEQNTKLSDQDMTTLEITRFNTTFLPEETEQMNKNVSKFIKEIDK